MELYAETKYMLRMFCKFKGQLLQYHIAKTQIGSGDQGIRDVSQPLTVHPQLSIAIR